MSNNARMKGHAGNHSDSSEGERFAHLLDGLLAVPHAEVAAAIEAEKAAKAKKKVRASAGRVGASRKR